MSVNSGFLPGVAQSNRVHGRVSLHDVSVDDMSRLGDSPGFHSGNPRTVAIAKTAHEIGKTGKTERFPDLYDGPPSPSRETRVDSTGSEAHRTVLARLVT